MGLVQSLKSHQQQLHLCHDCPQMHGPPVTGEPVASKVMLIGQAPGPKEIEVHKPFAWTAGKTMFRWFNDIGLGENEFRQKVYMAAVCRCFPGKNPKGGDRVPDDTEIANCSRWLEREMELLKPRLIIPVGKLAISQLMEFKKLTEVVGHEFELHDHWGRADIIPLPHPSGASTWHRMEPGISLLRQALGKIAEHPAWVRLCHDV